VGAATGVVSGVSGFGTSLITLTLPTGCSTAVTVTVNPLPGAISGLSTVCAGQTISLTDATTGGTWSSGNIAQATVGATTGIVTGVATGTPAISYILSTGCSATGLVTVNQAPASISGTALVCTGLTTALTDATSGGAWSSSNTLLATVGSTGIVTGVAAGFPNITYSIGACSSIVQVTVNTPPVAIGGGSLIICGGATTSLTDATTGGTWSSGNPSVATVGTTGIVTGASGGTSSIAYTIGGCSVSVIVTVNPSPSAISGVSGVCVGSTMVLTDGTTGGTWTSGTPSVATIVTATGVITGVAPGTTTITYALPTGCSATAVIPVNTAPLGIAGTASVCTGLTTLLTDITTGGAWSSSNTTLATVTASGVVTGVAAGLPNITYSIGSCISIVQLTVNTSPAPITGTMSVCAGFTTLLSDATTGGTWTSGNTSFATINSTTGVVTGVSGPTNVSIVYSVANGCSANAIITVNPTPVSIGGASFAVCAGSTISLTDATTGGAWSSSITSVATVGTTGVVTGVAGGTSSIIYALGGCSANVIVTVNPTPSAISGVSGVCVGSTMTLTDGSTGGTWASNTPSVATIGSATGVIGGVAPGVTTITYALSTGCNVTAVVPVNTQPVAIAGTASICTGLTTALTDLTSGGVWSSSNTTLATVNSASGVVTGVASGLPNITYSIGSCTSIVQLTVNTSPGAITGTMSVCTGLTTSLSDGTTGGTWTSSNTLFATVNSTTGVVTGVAGPNTVNIIYSIANGCSANAIVTVNPTPVSIGGSPLAVCAGFTTSLTDATTGGVWSSTITSVATVGTTGIVTGVTGGTSSIVYAIGGCSASAVVTVNPLPAAISSLSGICIGSSITLRDGSTGGTWASGALGVATVVAATGVVTGVNPGTSTITYALPTGCTTTAVVTVNTQPVAIAGTASVCTGLTTALTDATSGGVWSSSNTALATVSATGVVTGVAAGLPNITYSIGSCISTTQVTVNTSPGAITGTMIVCTGATITLGDTTAGGTWTSGNTSIATVTSTTGVVTGVSGINTVSIYYSVANGCSSNAIVTVNPLPVAIGGSPLAICVGVTTSLTDATTGGAWSTTDSVVATVGATGIVTGVAAGTSSIVYAFHTGCSASVVVTVNPVPSSITGVSGICVGSTITLGDATTGGTWTSSNTSIATVTPTTGIVTGVSSPNTVSIIYSLATGCSASAIVTVVSTPVAIGGSSFVVCMSSTTSLTDATTGGIWTSSTTSVATVGTTGVVTGVASGTSSIVYAIGSGCSASVVVTVTPIPNISNFTSPTATSECLGGGSVVTINSTSLGTGTFNVNYTLTGANPGSGSATMIMGLSSGTFTIPASALTTAGVTNITINSISTTTGCTSFPASSNTTSTTTFPLPTVYTVSVSGTGGYCAGGTGVHVLLSGSNFGINYQLYYAGAVVATMSGNGSPLDFGLETAVGSYTVVAANATTTCTVSMSGSAVVFINPLPVAYTVTGGGGYCSGGSGVAIGLSSSLTGISYQLYNGSTAVGSPVAGSTGSPITFGLQTAAGTYTVVADSTATGCTATMSGSATVVINTPPSTPITGVTSVCVGLTSVLADATTGGVWSSSSTSFATIGSATGIVNGVTTGTSSITYSLPTGCSLNTQVTVNPAPATITGSSIVCAGSTTTLTDGTTGGTWSSSSAAIASIGSSSGLVTGGSGGSTIITYTAPGGCSITFPLTVNPLPSAISGVTSVCVGSTIGLSDAGGGTWTSGNGSVATVGSSSGVVGGVGSGTASIVYALPTGCSISAIVTVNPVPAVITTTGTASVCVGLAISLVDATTGGTWASSNTLLATVSGTGIVTGVSNGVPVITYTLPTGCVSILPVTVNPLPSPLTAGTVCTGSTIGLSDAGGGAWSSSNGSVASVGSSSGVVGGITPGTSLITYTLATGCVASAVFTVNQTPLSISGTATVCTGLTTALADGTTGGTWSSSNNTEATVISTGVSSATVFGLTGGTPTISYIMPTGCFVTYIVTVNANPSSITGPSTVCTGTTIGLSDGGGGTWSSSNGSAATVTSSTGVVSGVAVGTTNITYTLATGCLITSTVTVNQTPVAISMLPVCIGGNATLTDGTTGGTWSSSNVAEATVGFSTGVAGGVSAGNPTITYMMPGTGCYTTGIETVNPLPSAISGPLNVCTGFTIALTDAGGGTWSSSNIAAATVGTSTGIVSGVAPGTTTITYTLPTGCTISTVITDNPQPAAISGIASVCIGFTSALTDATTGGTWASSNLTLATVGSVTGIVSGLVAGNPVISYTLPTGCFVTNIETVNSLPSAISGVSGICVGSTITLTDGGGGTWTSGTLAVATVVTATGVVTGVNPGTSTITYTLPTGCTASAVVTVNTQPVGIAGTATVCTGLTTALTDATSGGAWSSSNTAQATVTASGVVTGVTAGLPNITYTIGSCFSIVQVTVNTSPTPITGPLAVCVGLSTALGDATTGGTWTSSNTSFATINSTTGVVTGVAGLNTVVIVYSLPNACSVSAVVTVNPVPAAIGGGPLTVCAGSTTSLTDAISGGTWSSSTTSVAIVGTTGVVTGVASGTATISYTFGTGCSTSLVVTVNPTPNITSFTSPTATTVCSGGGSTVTVNSTSLGTGTYTVNYTLSGANVGTSTATLTMGPSNGTFFIPGASLSAIGVTNIAINSITNSSGCVSNLTSSNTTTTTTNPLPTVYTVTASGGGGYCAGGIGVHIYLSGSLFGINYQLYNGATPVGGPLAGTTSGLDFGLQTATGTYSVIATNTTTGCQNTMSGTPVVFINPLPTVNNVTGGGGYCFGGTGVPVGLNGSNAIYTYQLYNGASTVGGPVSGTGGAFNFGLETAAGTYTVVATNPATGCTSNMSGSATVVINPLPSAISGTTFACPGSTTTLSDAPSGGTWSSSNTAVATVGSGTGTVTGVTSGTTTITYTLPTGCTATAAVVVNPSPSAITGASNVCTGLTTTLADGGGGTWSSSNTLVANINLTSGLVSGIAPGNVTITYTLSTGCTATLSFTVNQTPAAISGTATVCTGLATALTDAYTGGTWSSSATGTATVNASTGVVTGVATGTATVTYTLPGGCTAMTVITVNPSPAIVTGANSICTGVPVPLNDATSGGTWTSSNPGEATVNASTGFVTGVAAGIPTITYILPAGCFALYPVTVNTSPAPITGINNVCTGLTTTLADVTTGGTWSSSSTSLATVGAATGIAGGVSAGTPSITYSLPTGCTAIIPLTVNPSPASISGVVNVCVGSTITLSDATSGGSWSSSSTSLATVVSLTGVVTGVAAGNPLITYTLPAGCIATLAISVNTTPGSISGPNTICVGQALALTDAPLGGVWTSSNTAVASVGSVTGIVTGGTSLSTATITYTLNPGACTATFVMTTNPNPAAITGTASVCVGNTTTLNDATSGGVWSSSNTVLATLSANIVTGAAAGLPVISYTLPTGCSSVVTVTVNSLPSAISGASSVCTGATTTLTDGTTGGTWSSSTGSVATVVTATGVVSGVSVGTTVITYTVSPGSCIVTSIITVNQTPAAIVGSNSICVGLTSALTDPLGGGTWSSSNNLLATVSSTGSASGTVTGVAAGTPVISYTLPAGCSALFPVTVNPTPLPITGIASVCTGSTTALSDPTIGGGTWSSSSTSNATVGATTGIVTGVAAGTPNITYTLPAGCSAIVQVTVNQSPAPITGTMNVCASGATTTLADATTGGIWSSGNTALATVGSTGVVTGISAGSLTITYALATGCNAVTALIVNPLPSAITGANNLCVGLTTVLSSGPSGGLWTSSNSSVAAVLSGSGIVSGAGGGTAIITYNLPATGCYVTYPFTVNALPAAFSVVGGGAYCVGGTGLNVSLSGSVTGISYQLLNGGAAVGSPLAGTGSALNFGSQTASGTYTVVATNTVTGCVNPMTGFAIIIISPLPNQYNITGGGNYCVGGSGVPVGLNGSDTGVNYRLFNSGGVAVGPVVSGTGSAIPFGLITPTGTYTVIATNRITGCMQTMFGVAVITTSPPPTVFTVTGGGGYCTGGTGVTIGLSGSQTGVNYQLLNSGSPLGGTVPGTGSALSFPGITATGPTFTISASSVPAGCTSTMTGSVSVTVNPLPSPFTVTSSATSYCAGGSGVTLGLSGSTSTYSYQLFSGSTAIGSPFIGTGSSFNFGLETIAGIPYTVVATNPVTACTVNMTGSITVTINPLPATFSVTGGGGYCSGSPGLPIGLSGSAIGTTYSLFLSGTVLPVSTFAGTGAAFNFTPVRTAAGSYTVVATTSVGSCTASMAGSEIITINSLPNAYTVTGGGAYCAGGTGLPVGLATSDIGMSYQLYQAGTPVGLPVIGTGSAISFGSQTVAAAYTVVATNPSTLCTAPMTGSVTITISPLPTSTYAVTGGGAYCTGGTGVAIGLANSSTTASYQLFNGATAVGLPLIGTGSSISFGSSFTAVGTYTVLATNTTTACSVNMLASVTVTTTTPPAAFGVTGGGSYCAGTTGVNVGLSGSVSGITYQLYLGGATVGSALPGTGSALNFGPQTDAGSYTVVAQSTLACTTTMTGTATVSINPLPVSTYSVTGGGEYCAGGTGVLVGLSGSQSGVSYQLYNGTAIAGSPVIGTGSAISFGLHTSNGVRTAVATIPATGCTSTMTGSVTVTINPLPTVYAMTMTGTGSYCPGGSGVLLGLTGSDPGVTYHLFLGTVEVGTGVAGTGATVSFGLQTGIGTYTAVATNTTTTCTSNMAGTETISLSPLPTAFTVTGGGSYCSGGAGVNIGLSGSVTGNNYQLYNGVATVGGPVAGTGGSLSFGLHAAAGTYTVIATGTVTACSATMTGSASVTVSPLPVVYSVTGGGSYCSGGAGVSIGMATTDTGIHYQLMRGATVVGSPVAGTGSAISFGLQTVAGSYTVVATNSTTTCNTNMAGTATISINPLPAAYIVGGGGSYCSGGSGVHVTLAGSDVGISYQLYHGSDTIGTSVAGTGLPFDFGLETAAGTYTAIATNSATGCVSTMSDSALVIVNSLPVVHTVTGGGSYCSGSTGVVVGLSVSDTGVHYQLYLGVSPVGSTVSGTGSAVSFGLQTVAGVYTVKATNAGTGCVNNMGGTATISISPLPTLYDVTSGGAYCAGGTGVNVGLTSSDLGRHYQLYRGTTAVGSSTAGVGGPIDFGLQTIAGTYKVVASNDTTGCSDTMTGSAIVTINPLPTAYTVTSSASSYCAGALGVDISLSGSSTGVTYQLYNSGVAVGVPVAGTGAALDFGLQPAGTYTVVAVNTTTSCTNTMSGSITIIMNALPAIEDVTGGGGYCAGTTGVHIYLDGSETGVAYQLYDGATAVTGAVMPGTGDGLDFGLFTTVGTYTIVAINDATGCTATMASSATVVINPLPTAYIVAGGGSYCASGAGVNVGLSGSDPGVSYQLYKGGLPVGSPVIGLGSGIDFGAQTAAGTYTVVATNPATGCVNTMSGIATISIIPLPATFTVIGGGNYCTGGSGVHVGISGSDTGVSYQLKYGGVALGSPSLGTGSPLDFGLQTSAGTYTVVATNMSTGCSSTMIGTAVVTISSLPAIYVVTGGGSYCASGAGIHVGLDTSVVGINYQLYNGSVAIGSPVAGTGMGALDFGLHPAGTYTVVAINAATGCTSVMSGTAIITITPSVTPSVSISTGVGDTVCAGSLTTFSALIVNGGPSPTYQWYVNGTLEATSASYSYVPTDGNVVSVSITSDAVCPSPAIVSNSVSMTVRALVSPSISVTASPGDTVCQGTAVTFVATPVFGGSTPIYSWLQNGVPVSSAESYTYVPANGDVVFCTLTSSYLCHVPGLAISNNIDMVVESNAAPVVSISISSGTTIDGVVYNDTLVAVVANPGLDPMYQWSVNGVNVPGAISSTFYSYTLNANDIVTCTVTNTSICGTLTGTHSVVVIPTPGNVGVKSVVAAGNNITLVPNPNNGYFTVKGTLSTTVDEELTMEVTDMLGQVIYNAKVMVHGGVINEKIQLDHSVANGMYILNLSSATDNRVFHVVIEQ